MAKAGPKNATSILHRALDLGVNFFHSAPKYQGGLSDGRYGHARHGGKRKQALLMRHVGGGRGAAGRGVPVSPHRFVVQTLLHSPIISP